MTAMTAYSDAQATLDDVTAGLTSVLPALQALNGTLDFGPLLAAAQAIVAVIPVAPEPEPAPSE